MKKIRGNIIFRAKASRLEVYSFFIAALLLSGGTVAGAIAYDVNVSHSDSKSEAGVPTPESTESGESNSRTTSMAATPSSEAGKDDSNPSGNAFRTENRQNYHDSTAGDNESGAPVTPNGPISDACQYTETQLASFDAQRASLNTRIQQTTAYVDYYRNENERLRAQYILEHQTDPITLAMINDPSWRAPSVGTFLDRNIAALDDLYIQIQLVPSC